MAGQGKLCSDTFEKRVPYLGIFLSEQHMLQLHGEVTRWMKTGVIAEGSTLRKRMGNGSWPFRS